MPLGRRFGENLPGFEMSDGFFAESEWHGCFLEPYKACVRVGLLVGMGQNESLDAFAFLATTVGRVDQTAKRVLIRAGVAGVKPRVAGTDDDQW